MVGLVLAAPAGYAIQIAHPRSQALNPSGIQMANFARAARDPKMRTSAVIRTQSIYSEALRVRRVEKKPAPIGDTAMAVKPERNNVCCCTVQRMPHQDHHV